MFKNLKLGSHGIRRKHATIIFLKKRNNMTPNDVLLY